MPLDETKTIKASDLVKSFEEVRYFLQPTILVSDTSANMTFSNFIAAVNLLIEDGWRVEPVGSQPGYMFALCHNPRYKRKNLVADS
jgi:hypothetical protein